MIRKRDFREKGTMEGLRTAEKERLQKSSQNAALQTLFVEKFPSVDLTQAHRGPSEYTRNGITVGIARNFDEMTAVCPLWRQMQREESARIPNVDYDRYASVIRSINDEVEPFVMYFKRGDMPLAMVVGRTQRHPLALKLGYLTVRCPKRKCLNIVYGGIMGRPEGRLCAMLIDELNAQLRSGRADMILFHHLRTDTAFYHAVRNAPGFLTRDRFPKTDEHWRMAVPDAMDKFYSVRSRGHRRNLRRAISKFEEDHAGEVRYVHYTAEEEVDDFLETAARISAKTYQHALNAGLVNDENTRAQIRAAAANGWFRGHILYAGDTPGAFQLGLQYENIYYMVNIGYDPAFRSYKPGLILYLKVLECLCDDSSVDTLDFYFGDAEYKQRYGTEHWQEASLYLFAPRACPMLFNALQITTTGVNAGLKYVVHKMGIVNRIKRKWRNLLRAPRPGPAKVRST
jgi:CelD/BcsL family acetyltransferase involved in cellulose biosynthesis